MNTVTIPARDLKPGDVYLHPLGGKARVSSIEIEPCWHPDFPDMIGLQVDRTGFGKTIRIAHSLRDGDKVELVSSNGRRDFSEEEPSDQMLFWNWLKYSSSENGQRLFWEWINE